MNKFESNAIEMSRELCKNAEELRAAAKELQRKAKEARILKLNLFVTANSFNENHESKILIFHSTPTSDL